MGTELSIVDNEQSCPSSHPSVQVTKHRVNYEAVVASEINENNVFPFSHPLPLETENRTPSPNWKKRFWSSLRRRSSRKKKLGDSEENQAPTSLEIRREHQKQLAESRPQLTEKQMGLIEDTWSVVQRDIATVGVDMFNGMFEAFPGVKGSFGPLNSMSSEDQSYQKEISKHGVRVLNTVDTILRLRHDPEKTIATLHDLGGKHISFNAKVDYIDLLGQHFLFAMEPVLQQHWTPEVEQAWADLFRLISHVMKEGMML